MRLDRRDIEKGLTIMIEGLNYNFFSPDGTNPDDGAKEMEEYVLKESGFSTLDELEESDSPLWTIYRKAADAVETGV